MPLLPSSGYSAQVGGLPLPAGRDHRASMEDPVAAAAGQFSHVAQQQADVFLRQKEEDNSRQVSVGASQIRVDTANDINAAEQSGADLEPIKQRMLDRFSKLGEGLETRKGADHLKFYTANASLMFDEQANRIAVQRAYSTATLGAAELMRNESKIIQDNPGYLPYATDNMRAYVDTFSKLSPERKNAIFDNQKKELNMTAALAGIRSDVKSGKEAVEKGKFDLNPEQYNTALRFADTRENALRTQDALLRADAARIVTEQNSDAYDAHFKDIRKATGSDVMKLEPSIMNDPNLKPETREHLINVMKQRVLELNGEGKAPNYTEYSRLLLAATAKDDDPTKIINTDAIRASLASNGGINSAQAERLMAIVGGQKDENQVKINTKINGLEHRFSTAVDGDLRLAAFTAPQKASITIDYDDRVRDLVSQARAANDPKALHALFDPKDKRYVGSQEFMQQSIDEAYTRQNAALPKVPTLKTQAEYDALPVGAVYIDTDGKRKVKR
jgi:hypothetical protein